MFISRKKICSCCRIGILLVGPRLAWRSVAQGTNESSTSTTNARAVRIAYWQLSPPAFWTKFLSFIFFALSMVSTAVVLKQLQRERVYCSVPNCARGRYKRLQFRGSRFASPFTPVDDKLKVSIDQRLRSVSIFHSLRSRKRLDGR